MQGMGEPLNNYEQVRTATRTMINPALFGLKRSKVTISTVGIIPRILQVQGCFSSSRQRTLPLRPCPVPSCCAQRMRSL